MTQGEGDSLKFSHSLHEDNITIYEDVTAEERVAGRGWEGSA